MKIPKTYADHLGMWGAGLILAIVPFGYGVSCLLTGRALFFGRHGSIVVEGSAAIALAISYISIGCLLHFQYFWANQWTLSPYHPLGKTASEG